jgi:hypothetical protein
MLMLKDARILSIRPIDRLIDRSADGALPVARRCPCPSWDPRARSRSQLSSEFKCGTNFFMTSSIAYTFTLNNYTEEQWTKIQDLGKLKAR